MRLRLRSISQFRCHCLFSRVGLRSDLGLCLFDDFFGWRQVTANRWGLTCQHPKYGYQFMLDVASMGNAIQHPVIQKVFCALEPFRQFFPNSLFDDPWSGKANQSVRFGDMDVTQHRIRRRDTARRP